MSQGQHRDIINLACTTLAETVERGERLLPDGSEHPAAGPVGTRSGCPSLACRDGGALMSSIVRIRNLAVGYPGLTLFRQLSIDIEAGWTLAVLGANGAGKSTLVKTLLGLMSPLEGRIEWPAGRPHEIAYLAQMTEFDRRFPIRVRDLAAMGQWKGLGLTSGLDRARRAQVIEALEQAGVADIADRSLHTLSGGQLQRTLFARVIMQDAPLILLDEPFAAVDQSTEAHLLGIIERWREEGRAVLLVVHDLSSVLDHCSHALLLGGGEASHGLVNDVLTPQKLVQQGYLSASQADWMFRGRRTNGETTHA